MAVQLQSNFTVGEISELLHARVDFAGYYKGAKKLRNVLVIPQGGVRRRFGTDQINTIEDVSSHTEIKGTILDYDDEDRYTLIFTPFLLTIYHDDEVVATLVTLFTADEIQTINFAQSNNLLYMMHANHKPAVLKRTNPHDGWIINFDPTFRARPVYDFRRNYDEVNFTIKSGGIPITTAQNKLGQDVELHANTAIFDVDYEGGLFFADGGTLRLTTFNTNMIMNARVIQTFDNDSGLFAPFAKIKGEDSFLAEPAFGDTRGWPEKASFYQDRIIFGRSRSLPTGIWLSTTNGFNEDFLDFDDSDATLDTSAISVFIYNKKAAIVEHILPYKSLIIFTSSGVFSTPVLEANPLTPSNAGFSLQIQDSASAVEPFVIDNQVVFFDKGGKIAKNIMFSTENGSYTSSNISVLSPQLIDNPSSAATLETPDFFDGVYLFAVNSGPSLEGTLEVYQTLQAQQVNGWTLATTDGKFRQVFSDEKNVYFIVERIIEEEPVFYLEKLNFERFTDCAKFQTFGSPTDTITGLEHLEGKMVRAIGDGFIFSERQVVSGQITLPKAVNSVEVGLFFKPEVTLMPINVQLQGGAFDLYLPKRIKALFVDFYQSLGVKINNILIPDLAPNLDQYDIPAVPKSGFYEATMFLGYDPRSDITISQDDPLPFLIRGVGTIVETTEV